jgi:hypothetical protein
MQGSKKILRHPILPLPVEQLADGRRIGAIEVGDSKRFGSDVHPNALSRLHVRSKPGAGQFLGQLTLLILTERFRQVLLQVLRDELGVHHGERLAQLLQRRRHSALNFA